MDKNSLLIDHWTSEEDEDLKEFLRKAKPTYDKPSYDKVKKFLAETTVKKFIKKYEGYGWVKGDFILRFDELFGSYHFELSWC